MLTKAICDTGITGTSRGKHLQKEAFFLLYMYSSQSMSNPYEKICTDILSNHILICLA
jgi:hypothetical protein